MYTQLLSLLAQGALNGMSQQNGQPANQPGPMMGIAPDGGPIEVPPLGNDGQPLPPVSGSQNPFAMGQGGGTSFDGGPGVLPSMDGMGASGGSNYMGGDANSVGQALAAQQQAMIAPMASQGGVAMPFSPAAPMMNGGMGNPSLESNYGGGTQQVTNGSTQQKTNWGQLFNPIGTASEPNALVRLGVGYNQGGLLGSLGYLLTDMTRQGNQPPKQNNSF